MLSSLPTCTVELTEYSKELRYFCQACPYVYSIDKKVSFSLGYGTLLKAMHLVEYSCPKM